MYTELPTAVVAAQYNSFAAQRFQETSLSRENVHRRGRGAECSILEPTSIPGSGVASVEANRGENAVCQGMKVVVSSYLFCMLLCMM